MGLAPPTHPALRRPTVARVPVVIRAIDASMQTIEAHVARSLAVGDARWVQADSDRLLPIVRLHYQHTCRSFRIADLVSLPSRPQKHSLTFALTAGAFVWPLYRSPRLAPNTSIALASYAVGDASGGRRAKCVCLV